MAIDPTSALDIGIEGYTYLYPLVLMDVTREQMTNVVHPGDLPLRSPADVFVHNATFPDSDFRDVVRPNFDTLYSGAWLPLHDEPRIVSLPAAGDQYYLVPMYDMWGEVFASPGTRTTGSGAGDFAVVGPGWEGELPAGVRRYDAPTSWVWLIGRVEASPATYDAVHAFQEGMRITPLSAWGGEPPVVTGRVDPAIDASTPPLRQVFALDAAAFFARAAELITQYAPHAMDAPILDRLAQIGFRVGEPFDLGAAEQAVQEALTESVPVAQQRITAQQRTIGAHVNGWVMMTRSMGTYGTDYLARACVELVGLGANLAEDAIYPLLFTDADGAPLDGANRYVWHIAADEIPPVNAFWSLTMYDMEGFQVANELNRFAIGDRDDLRFNDDGSLDILIQHERPADGPSNWLPAPHGVFNVTARLYYPKRAALDGTWAPPPVRKVG